MKVHRLSFTIDGEEALAGYRARLPDETFAHPPAAIDGIDLRVVSPLALYQMRVALSKQGSFGELSERQRASSRALRARFMAGLSEEGLAPLITPLA